MINLQLIRPKGREGGRGKHVCLACLDLCSCTHIARRKGENRIKIILLKQYRNFFYEFGKYGTPSSAC